MLKQIVNSRKKKPNSKCSVIHISHITESQLEPMNLEISCNLCMNSPLYITILKVTRTHFYLSPHPKQGFKGNRTQAYESSVRPQFQGNLHVHMAHAANKRQIEPCQKASPRCFKSHNIKQVFNKIKLAIKLQHIQYVYLLSTFKHLRIIQI